MTNQTNNLFNEVTFYPAFIKDMLGAKEEVIIYSPFISKFRADYFWRTLLRLKRRNINVFIFTRPIEEQEGYIQEEIRSAIKDYQKLGAHITFLRGSIHEKIAIIDRKILWEGSMNILSQRSSKELMVRMTDESFVDEVMSRLGLDRRIIERFKITGTSNGLSRWLRIKYFISEPIRWSLSIVYKIMIILLRSILIIFNIVDAIVG